MYNTIGRAYDVTSDGERFLMMALDENENASTIELVAVHNWTQELLERVPLN